MEKHMRNNSFQLGKLTVERESFGKFVSKDGDREVARLELSPDGVALSSFRTGIIYKSSSGRHIGVDGEVRFILNPQTNRIKEVRVPNTSYSAFLEEKKEVWIHDKLKLDGEEFVHHFKVDLDKSSREIVKLLKLPLIREDWEKIQAMKNLR